MNEKLIAQKAKITKIKSDFREKTTGYILTALGLVAGLAWNDLISSAIKYFFPLDNNSLIAKLIYALILTVLIIIVSNTLLRILTLKEERDAK